MGMNGHKACTCNLVGEQKVAPGMVKLQATLGTGPAEGGMNSPAEITNNSKGGQVLGASMATACAEVLAASCWAGGPALLHIHCT